jgi:hypothetical protein
MGNNLPTCTHMCGFKSYSVDWNQINAKQMYSGTCPAVVCGGLQFRPSELHVFQGQGLMTRGLTLSLNSIW